ncbi:ATP-grasp domain-containing protein [Fundidesulfovibrio agrisoli]|uniref:ATP-grasp domain-containing protein n=1 Tax=Fundidesulfovibrio agrisoli TaxID=2922717 RepID=UPI001FAD498F|nr:ATP-grasp domain-containing protein [Fundidesulfovibrio agrisoli]
MDAQKRVAQIVTALQGRQLVYFGTRGADAEPLLKIPNFQVIVSLIAPLQASTVRETCLETLTSERVELDDYTIDHDTRPVVSEMRRALLREFEGPSALLAYRPCAFLSSAWFPRSDRVQYLGLFHGHQSCFEHKAWMETQLAAFGVPVLPWRFFADEEADIIREWVAVEPIVLRANRSDGGLGVRFVPNPGALEVQWPSHGDGFLAVTEYLSDSISLNINACVFADGSASLHGPSVQLIGIPALTSRTFGYCGNDFGAAGLLEPSILDSFENLTRLTARWLRSQGYLGVFGVDAIVHKGEVYLTEVNPRFQGSSLLSARVDGELGRSDVFLENLAAFLGLPAQEQPRLRDLAAGQPPLAHAVAHNLAGQTVRLTAAPHVPDGVECRLLPDVGVAIPNDCITFDAVFPGPITADGSRLTDEAAAAIGALKQGVNC